jgi:hypothetical protein
VTIAAPGWTFEAQLEEVRARDPLWMRNFKMAKPLKHRRGTVRPSTAYHEAGHAVAAFFSRRPIAVVLQSGWRVVGATPRRPSGARGARAR